MHILQMELNGVAIHYAYCPSQAFDWCDNISSNTSTKRNFDEVYSNVPNKTINLVA